MLVLVAPASGISADSKFKKYFVLVIYGLGNILSFNQHTNMFCFVFPSSYIYS